MRTCLTTMQFIDKSINVHGNKYDYSKTQYTFSKNKVKIICKIESHGEFEQKSGLHLRGSGCPLCGYTTQGKKLNSNTESFINKAKLIHEHDYDYSQCEYINSKTKIIIKCKIHGIFEQTPHNHLLGKGCPTCKMSKGERKIRSYLKRNNIEFQCQKKFNECLALNNNSNNKLPFDFYLPKLNTCIEFDGPQHFSAFRLNKMSQERATQNYRRTQLNDSIKNFFCLQNGIKMVRIPFFEYTEIENKLNKMLNN